MENVRLENMETDFYGKRLLMTFLRISNNPSDGERVGKASYEGLCWVKLLQKSLQFNISVASDILISKSKLTHNL